MAVGGIDLHEILIHRVHSMVGVNLHDEMIQAPTTIAMDISQATVLLGST